MPRKRQVAWTLRAQGDVVEARAFLRSVSPGAAKQFTSRVREAVDKLGQLPTMGARHDFAPLPGEFRSVVVGFHRIIYRSDLPQILIYRVWDCRRDPAKMWER